MMADRKIITPEGEKFLIQSLDPFHDKPIDPVGYPDSSNAYSNVYAIRSGITVTRPSIVPSTDNWSVNIFNLPVLGRVDMGALLSPVPGSSNYMPVQQAPVRLYGFLNAISGPDGSDLSVVTPSASSDIQKIDILPSDLPDDFRVVGAGYEIRDSTSELYKQGVLTSYKVPVAQSIKQNLFCTSTVPYNAVGGIGETLIINDVPGTQTEALYSPGATKRLAKDGSYVVLTQAQSENPFSDFHSCGLSVKETAVDTIRTTVVLGSAGQYYYGRQKLLPFNSHGSILTGLHPLASIDITMIVYVERLPTTASSRDLQRLARQSSPYDPIALQLYSEAFHHLPISVPVDENGLGDWFLDVVGQVSKFVGPIAKMIPHPIAQGIGAIADNINNSKVMTKRQNERKITKLKATKDKNDKTPTSPKYYANLLFTSPDEQMFDVPGLGRISREQVKKLAINKKSPNTIINV